MSNEMREGWQMEGAFNQRRWHYIEGSTSICGRFGFYMARMDATGVSDRVAQQPAERCSMCRDGVSHSARCHHDEHEVCDRVAEGTDAPKSCACPCHSPADPVRCPKCGGPHPFHDPACVVHPDLIQDQSGTGAE